MNRDEALDYMENWICKNQPTTYMAFIRAMREHPDPNVIRIARRNAPYFITLGGWDVDPSGNYGVPDDPHRADRTLSDALLADREGVSIENPNPTN